MHEKVHFQTILSRARFDRDEMVFGDFTGGGGLDNRENNQRDEASRIQALRTANCIKILGKGVIRVVHRVDDARENNALGKQTQNLHFSSLVEE